MATPSFPFISKVKIKNFRNFLEAEVELSKKVVLIGENNTGKTNLLAAIRLILDPSLSENDRMLTVTDFNTSVSNPEATGEIIEIMIELQGWDANSNMWAQFEDAKINTSAPLTIRLTYQYYPEKDADGNYTGYSYRIFQGVKPEVPFGFKERKMLNFRLIPALRNVEAEMKSASRSPLKSLFSNYQIERTELEKLGADLKDAADKVLSLDEVSVVIDLVDKRFKALSGAHPDSDVKISPMEINPDKVIDTLQLLMGDQGRSLSEVSLGLCNILYISLLLLSLEDKTVPTFLKKANFDSLSMKNGGGVLTRVFEPSPKGNYFLKANLTDSESVELYKFFDDQPHNTRFTILAIEEPEAHLHPTLQRLIFKDIMKDGKSSVWFTTHSTHIASVAPLESILHVRRKDDHTSQLFSNKNIGLDPSTTKDIERYLDANRGEIYFGRGVVLVEGIAEEYLVPRFAELLEMPFDNHAIVVCNINSTNFKPYLKLLKGLAIPYVVITDGDYYHTVGNEKVFHVLHDTKHTGIGHYGRELILKNLEDVGLATPEEVATLTNTRLAREFIESKNCFTGEYTFEVEIMRLATTDSIREAIIDTYNELTLGGELKKLNFKNELISKEYFKCLNKIEENGVRKGRFSQRFASKCTVDHVPAYIKRAIEKIHSLVQP